MRFLSPVRHPDLATVQRAWSHFVTTGACAPADVRPYVMRAWERSRAAGCDATQGRAQRLSAAQTAQLLQAQDGLVHVAAPFLSALSRAAGADRHAAMLADGQGRLLQVVGDEATLADENFPSPGTLLSEAIAGANGVGTTLAENGYVELVGPEHYIEGFHAFTCQGVPLASPEAECAGVLSMSVRRLDTADRVRDILFCASEAAQCELLARWLSSATAGGERGATLERLRQDMVQRITMVRLRLELAARQIANGADATATIDAAHDLSRRFRRQSAIWRHLALTEVATPQPERIELADLAADFVDLLQTEARVAAVTLRWGRAARVIVVEDPRLLSQRLLSAFLTAMQTATLGATLEINIHEAGGRGYLHLMEAGAPKVLPMSPMSPMPPLATVSAPRLH